MLHSQMVGDAHGCIYPMAAHRRARRHAYGHGIACILCLLAIAVLAVRDCIYGVSYCTFRHCQRAAAGSFSLQLRSCSVPLYISFRISLALQVTRSGTDACVRGAEVGDDDHSLVASHLGIFVIEREMPTAVVVHGIIALRLCLCICCHAQACNNQAKNKVMFHKGSFWLVLNIYPYRT